MSQLSNRRLVIWGAEREVQVDGRDNILPHLLAEFIQLDLSDDLLLRGWNEKRLKENWSDAGI
jgi:hypothetical protein